MGSAIGNSALLSAVWCALIGLVGFRWAIKLYERAPHGPDVEKLRRSVDRPTYNDAIVAGLAALVDGPPGHPRRRAASCPGLAEYSNAPHRLAEVLGGRTSAAPGLVGHGLLPARVSAGSCPA